MKKDTTPAAADAVGSQLVRGVRPVAEIVGGVLRWHIPEPDYALAQHYLRGVHLLYDQAALDAADEGARVAYGHLLSAQKRTLERECTHLRGLLDDAHAQIRRQAELLNSRA